MVAWWAYGEARYGERKAHVEAGNWEGPSFGACANAARVCRAFETSRRHEPLGFQRHAEVASLPPDEADALISVDYAPFAGLILGKGTGFLSGSFVNWKFVTDRDAKFSVNG